MKKQVLKRIALALAFMLVASISWASTPNDTHNFPNDPGITIADNDQQTPENWMTDINYWNVEIDELQTTAAKAGTEQWMTDCGMWLERIDLNSITTENWMSNFAYWIERFNKDDCQAKAWMLTTEYWKK